MGWVTLLRNLLIKHVDKKYKLLFYVYKYQQTDNVFSMLHKTLKFRLFFVTCFLSLENWVDKSVKFENSMFDNFFVFQPIDWEFCDFHDTLQFSKCWCANWNATEIFVIFMILESSKWDVKTNVYIFSNIKYLFFEMKSKKSFDTTFANFFR